jgi:hypothetical protein
LHVCFLSVRVWHVLHLICKYFDCLSSCFCCTYFTLFVVTQILTCSISYGLLPHVAGLNEQNNKYKYLILQVIQSKCLQVISNYPRCIPTYHFAQLSKHWTQPSYHPTTYSQTFCLLPFPPQPPGPTNWELYSSWPDCYVQETQKQLIHILL